MARTKWGFISAFSSDCRSKHAYCSNCLLHSNCIRKLTQKYLTGRVIGKVQWCAVWKAVWVTVALLIVFVRVNDI